jgi:hypothetical protein
MSIRSLITTIAVAAALLAFPVVASARFSNIDPVSGPPQPTAVAPVAPAAGHHDGTGTVTVLVIAGLTLLAGAATGAGGVKVAQRRGHALQA